MSGKTESTALDAALEHIDSLDRLIKAQDALIERLTQLRDKQDELIAQLKSLLPTP